MSEDKTLLILLIVFSICLFIWYLVCTCVVYLFYKIGRNRRPIRAATSAQTPLISTKNDLNPV